MPEATPRIALVGNPFSGGFGMRGTTARTYASRSQLLGKTCSVAQSSAPRTSGSDRSVVSALEPNSGVVPLKNCSLRHKRKFLPYSELEAHLRHWRLLSCSPTRKESSCEWPAAPKIRGDTCATPRSCGKRKYLTATPLMEQMGRTRQGHVLESQTGRPSTISKGVLQMQY